MLSTSSPGGRLEALPVQLRAFDLVSRREAGRFSHAAESFQPRLQEEAGSSSRATESFNLVSRREAVSFSHAAESFQLCLQEKFLYTGV